MNTALQLPDGRCAQALRLQPYRETLALRAGPPVLLRPAHRGDAAALQALFAGLSLRSRRWRFHGAVRQLPDAVLERFTTQVPQRHVALVALRQTDDGLPRLVAEARYLTGHLRPGQGEFALTVADELQGLGLGRALLQRLAAHAASQGLAELVGQVLPDNGPMLALLQRLGAAVEPDGSELRATLGLM